MVISFCFKVTGEFKGEDLWPFIKGGGANMLDAGDTVWVYGRTSLYELTDIVQHCAAFGEIAGEIHTRRE